MIVANAHIKKPARQCVAWFLKPFSFVSLLLTLCLTNNPFIYNE